VAYKPVARQRPKNKETRAVAVQRRCKHTLRTMFSVGNGVMQPVARQLQHLHFNNGNGVSSIWSVPRRYLEDNWGDPVFGSCQLTVS
jgi:hypothetical protein